MATLTQLGTSTFTTISGTKTLTATPAVGDLVLLITAHTGNTSVIAPTDDQGGVYEQAPPSAVMNVSADTMQFWVRTTLIPSAISMVFTHAPGTTTGGGLIGIVSNGGTRVGKDAIGQTAVENNLAAAGTPAPVFAAAPVTANPVLGVVFNNTNPATMTPRTGYVERFDNGYTLPATGIEGMTINSGETSPTITWGGTSASIYCTLAAEFDQTAPQTLSVLAGQACL